MSTYTSIEFARLLAQPNVNNKDRRRVTVKECGSINWISFDAFLISVLSADRFTKATPSRLNLIAKFSLGANWYIRNFRQPRG